jgi:UDP-2-acetamido-3-amino-2,3-dideoxy-glucuronate N-acetyltransferase
VFTNVINPRSEIDRKHEYQTTKVGRGATIGANATIVCGNNIGDYAFIGAGAVVTANVPAYALVIGVPGRQIGWICRCGVRLEVDGGAAYCAVCGRGYRGEDGGLCEA